MQYVAFLRGINVGGNAIVMMEDLRSLFTSLGFVNVKTLLNSGNIIFEAKEEDKDTLTPMIEKHLQTRFGFAISIMLRTKDEIQKLLTSAPFQAIPLTPDTRLYVTFLTEKKAENMLKIPSISPEKDFQILHATKSEICSVLILSPQKKTPNLMKEIEKEYGKKITTRSWNTIVKLGKLMN